MTSLPEPGERVAHFRILRKIGEGGMGAVFEAEDERLGRRVALKILPPEFVTDPERRARFFREARSAAAVQSRRIAAVHEIGEDDGRIFIAMELVRGESLRQVVGRRALDLDEALRIARDVAGALDKAHSAGVVHRDLKPENVMLDADGEAKVLDFGLATAMPGRAGVPSDGALPATLGANEYLDGCEAFVRGDMKAAVASWRSLVAVPGYLYALRPEAFDAAGEGDLAWRIDEYRVARSYRTELAHVRQALRAESKGDSAEARRLAQRVVDKWSTADAEIPHVKRMRSLLARTASR